MIRYSVFLEIAGDGLCMAHVPDLPGCTVRAPTQDEALRQLTEEERSGVFYPTLWTRHPEEPWTARKALRPSWCLPLAHMSLLSC